MKKSVKIIIGIVIIVAILAVIVLAVNFSNKNSNGKTSLPEINSSEDLSSLIEKIYEQLKLTYQMLLL